MTLSIVKIALAAASAAAPALAAEGSGHSTRYVDSVTISFLLYC